METELLKSQFLTEKILLLTFKKPDSVHFDAGDFLELSIPDSGVAGRWMSIASGPQADHLRFLTKIPPKPSEFKQALAKLSVGDKALVSPAMGQFNLPRHVKNKKIIFFAGGVGLSPFLSMLQDEAAKNFEIQLIYSAKPGEHVLLDELAESSATLHLHENYSGSFKISDIASYVTDWQDHLIYLSGAEILIKKLYEDLLETKISKKKIKLDYFTGYTQL